MDATLNWLEWFGAARAPSDFDLTINWAFLSSKEFGADCKLDFDNGKLAFDIRKGLAFDIQSRPIATATDWEAKLVLFCLRHSARAIDKKPQLVWFREELFART